MAKKTKGAFDSWIDSFINTNGVQGITGALMNAAFRDLSDSIFWGERREERNVVMNKAGTAVVFSTPMTNDQYTLIVRTHDTSGDYIEWRIDPALMTAAGFTVVPASDGFISYHAISF